MTTTTLAHDLDEIRVLELELSDLSPDERELVAGRIARFARTVAPPGDERRLLEARAAELERTDGEDLERLEALLDDVCALLAAAAPDAPLGAGYDGPALEHEP